ncbi:MAG: sugar phosphate isomerase/epimerase [Thermoflexales bacterium]|nr:sugar phosphate isomerase/epimerase [Thermoflexales bacterium]
MHIAISAWSFHQSLHAGKLRQVEVPERSAELGFKHVELLEMFLQPTPPGRLARLFFRLPAVDGQTSQPDYSRRTLRELRSARLRRGVRLACWAIDTDLTLISAEARRAQLGHIATALEAARYLGAPLVRLTIGGEAGDVTGVGRAIDMLRNVAVVAASSGLKLAVENHFGLSADAQVLAELITAIKQPHVGACLDFGNFGAGQAEAGLQLLAPLAIHAHAKSREFAPDGEEAHIDYRSALQALQAASYNGAISIEYEGEGPAAEGIRQTWALIERHWRDT